MEGRAGVEDVLWALNTFFPITSHSPHLEKPCSTAGAVRCMRTPRRRSSGKDDDRRASCSSVSSRATKRTAPGTPFVGPAGQLLDRALDEAGIDRKETYLTNAVKHFKWKARGTRRIHDKPSWSEQLACRPWLEAELAIIEPEVLVLLGATAAQTLLGRSFRVTRDRGRQPHSDLAGIVIATIHPSAILRSTDRDEMFRGFVVDLTLASH